MRMVWSWRVYVPLVESVASPDCAHLLGESLCVDTLDETHYAITPAVSLRRVQDAAAGTDYMELSIRSAHNYSAGVECWTKRPKLLLTCGNASATVALEEARLKGWLHRQAEWSAAKQTQRPQARSRAIPVPEPVTELRALADGEISPPYVWLRRRRIRSTGPSAAGVLLEQSDLSVPEDGSLWRTVSCESTSAANVRHAVGEIAATFMTIGAAPGVLAATPMFIQTLLRSRASQPEVPPSLTESTSAKDPFWICGVDGAAPQKGRTAVTGEASLVNDLLDAWGESSDVFSKRMHHATQEHPQQWLPKTEHWPTEAIPIANCRDHYHAYLVPVTPLAKRDSTPMCVSQQHGLLAQFPAHVVRRTLGQAAADGRPLELERLLLGCRGAHLNQPCGLPHAPRWAALHHAAAAGHAYCVQLLLRHSAEPHTTAEGGQTALHLAAAAGSAAHAACARLLVRYGASPEQPNLIGCSPMDLASTSDSGECAALLAEVATPTSMGMAPARWDRAGTSDSSRLPKSPEHAIKPLLVSPNGEYRV